MPQQTPRTQPPALYDREGRGYRSLLRWTIQEAFRLPPFCQKGGPRGDFRPIFLFTNRGNPPQSPFEKGGRPHPAVTKPSESLVE